MAWMRVQTLTLTLTLTIVVVEWFQLRGVNPFVPGIGIRLFIRGTERGLQRLDRRAKCPRDGAPVDAAWRCMRALIGREGVCTAGCVSKDKRRDSAVRLTVARTRFVGDWVVIGYLGGVRVDAREGFRPVERRRPVRPRRPARDGRGGSRRRRRLRRHPPEFLRRYCLPIRRFHPGAIVHLAEGVRARRCNELVHRRRSRSRDANRGRRRALELVLRRLHRLLVHLGVGRHHRNQTRVGLQRRRIPLSDHLSSASPGSSGEDVLRPSNKRGRRSSR
mmetsp:Transcript_7556/g.34231  ORF Transcript_7556/g.34231 Transcript_7556/m.34231 type:complete len:276 (+) Transcript_7556:1132-1959(+)